MDGKMLNKENQFFEFFTIIIFHYKNKKKKELLDLSELQLNEVLFPGTHQRFFFCFFLALHFIY